MSIMVKPDEPIRHFRDEPLTTVYRRWICAKDGCSGEMKPSGGALMSNPPQYPHRCSICERAESATMAYPRLAYLPLEALVVDAPSVPSDQCGGGA